MTLVQLAILIDEAIEQGHGNKPVFVFSEEPPLEIIDLDLTISDRVDINTKLA